MGRRAFLRRVAGAGVSLSAAATLGCLAGAAPALAAPGSVAGAPAAGSGAGASTGCMHGTEPRGLAFARQARSREGRFGFMFKRLQAFEPPDELLTDLAASMAEPSDASLDAFDNPDIPAGYTFLGQFIAHDLTLDATPLDEQRTDPNALVNFRSPRFDLDSVYGGGPASHPQFYDPADPAKLAVLTRTDGVRDLPRDDAGVAIVGDPRDDLNLITTQIHLAVRRFHNTVVDHLRGQGLSGSAVFEDARRQVRWHYQWIIVHDFLPRIVGRDLLDQIIIERAGGPASVRLRHYRPQDPNRPMLPVEFAGAAYRFGHSMIRGGYFLNDDAGGLFFEAEPNGFNLNGLRPIPEHLVIDWRHFFDFPGEPARQLAHRIDGLLSFPLFTMPSSVVPPPDPRTSLAERNLVRGKRLGLPSGQDVAREMGVDVLSNTELGLHDPAWGGRAPLWFYVLNEAALRQDGRRLGAVGAGIVAEVFAGLLHLDAGSYLNAAHGWRPQPPIASAPGGFTMSDLLTYADR